MDNYLPEEIPNDIQLNIIDYADAKTYIAFQNIKLSKLRDARMKIDKATRDLFNKNLIRFISDYINEKDESIYILPDVLHDGDQDYIIELLLKHFKQRITYVPCRRHLEYNTYDPLEFKDIEDITEENVKWELSKLNKKPKPLDSIDHWDTWCINEDFEIVNNDKFDMDNAYKAFDDTELSDESKSYYTKRNFLLLDSFRNKLKIKNNTKEETVAYDALDKMAIKNNVEFEPLGSYGGERIGWDFPRSWGGFYYTYILKIRCTRELTRVVRKSDIYEDEESSDEE